MSLCNNCIKSATGSKTPNGITITFTGTFEEIPSTFKVGNYTLTLKSITKVSPLLKTITYSTTFSESIVGSAHFKVIPNSLYNALKEYDQLTKLLAEISSPSAPTNIFIKTGGDEYAQDVGFSPAEIFSTFGLEVIYPPSLEYNITELVIRDGMSVAALIHSIFPIPGTISFIDDKTISFSIAPDIINVTSAIESSYSYQVETFSVTVTGMQSEPRNVISDSDTTKTITSSNGDASMEVIYNIFGRVYGIVKEEYVISSFEGPTLNYLEQLLLSQL